MTYLDVNARRELCEEKPVAEKIETGIQGL
jgi:hypothetical protein